MIIFFMSCNSVVFLFNVVLDCEGYAEQRHLLEYDGNVAANVGLVALPN